LTVAVERTVSELGACDIRTDERTDESQRCSVTTLSPAEWLVASEAVAEDRDIELIPLTHCRPN